MHRVCNAAKKVLLNNASRDAYFLFGPETARCSECNSRQEFVLYYTSQVPMAADTFKIAVLAVFLFFFNNGAMRKIAIIGALP